MALAFLKTVYDWTTGNDMPDDLRKRQESMERRQEQRNTVVRPFTKRDISKIPSVPTYGDEEISDDDEKKMLRDKQQQQRQQQQSPNNKKQKTSTERKSSSSSKGFDNIMEVQRRSFVGDLMPVAGSCVDENDDENQHLPSIEMKNKTHRGDFSDHDDDDDEEDEQSHEQKQKRRQQEHDDEASHQTNQQELTTLKEIVAGGSKNIDASWTERPRTYKWIEEKQKKLDAEHKKAESAGKSVKDMANEQVLAPALRLRADAAKKLQRGRNNNNVDQETKPSSPSPSPPPTSTAEDVLQQKLLHAQKRAQVARQLQIKLKNFAEEKNNSGKKVAQEGEDDDFLKGIEEEGCVDSSQRNNTSSSNDDDEDEVSQNNVSKKSRGVDVVSMVSQKPASGNRKVQGEQSSAGDDVFAIEDDEDSLHFSSDADSEN